MNEFKSNLRESACWILFTIILDCTWFLMIAISFLMNFSKQICSIFHKWDDDSGQFEIIAEVVITIWMFVFISILCEPGARAVNQFEMFGEELHWCDWYLMEVDMQRMYMVLLSVTQQPINISSYDSTEKGINCNWHLYSIFIHLLAQFYLSQLFIFSWSSRLYNTLWLCVNLQLSHIKFILKINKF